MEELKTVKVLNRFEYLTVFPGFVGVIVFTFLPIGTLLLKQVECFVKTSL